MSNERVLAIFNEERQIWNAVQQRRHIDIKWMGHINLPSKQILEDLIKGHGAGTKRRGRPGYTYIFL